MTAESLPCVAMLDALLSLDRLTTIAHRGGAGLRPENTIAAFDHAMTLGVDALECDVHLSRDGEPVVIHDPTLDRTTDAAGPVAALTVAELGRVDAGYRFAVDGAYAYRGTECRVPTLDAVITRYPAIPIVIEIKGDNPDVAARALAVVRAHRAEPRVILGGFSHAVLAAVRAAAPHLVTSASSVEARSALTRSYFGLRPARPAFQLFQMPFRFRGRQMFRRPFVRAARRGRIPVHSWIIDHPDDMRRLIAWGVTGIITDRPDVAVPLCRDEDRRRAAAISAHAATPPRRAAP